MFMCKAKYKMNLHSHAFFDYIIFLSLTETKIKDKHVASFWKEGGGGVRSNPTSSQAKIK